MVWDKAGIRVWYFQRSNIPSDIKSDQPDPTSWGTPMANFPSDDCSPYTYFYDHYNIFDTTLCGDWAGADAVWNYAGYAGQDQSCASLTGYSTCSDFVLNSGHSFNDAYWEVSTHPLSLGVGTDGWYRSPRSSTSTRPARFDSHVDITKMRTTAL